MAEGSAFRLLAEYPPPTRALTLPGHRGTTFSTTASHLMYNVNDTCVVVALGGDGAREEAVSFPFREFVVCHDLHAIERPSGRGAELHALVALASGEILRWTPLARRSSE